MAVQKDGIRNFILSPTVVVYVCEHVICVCVHNLYSISNSCGELATILKQNLLSGAHYTMVATSFCLELTLQLWLLPYFILCSDIHNGCYVRGREGDRLIEESQCSLFLYLTQDSVCFFLPQCVT